MAAQSKRTGEAKVIAARAEVESAKLMRQAADILSSAPAMQIRYLEAMQAMAKSANSKVSTKQSIYKKIKANCALQVIFLPAPNQTMQANMIMADAIGEGPSKYRDTDLSGVNAGEYNFNANGMGNAVGARNVENI